MTTALRRARFFVRTPTGELNLDGLAPAKTPAASPGTAFSFRVGGVALGHGTVHVTDATDATDLAKWKSLTLGGIDAQLEPLEVSVGAITFDDFYTRLILNETGEFNLRQLAQSDTGCDVAGRNQRAAGRRAGDTVCTRLKFFRNRATQSDWRRICRVKKWRR